MILKAHMLDFLLQPPVKFVKDHVGSIWTYHIPIQEFHLPILKIFLSVRQDGFGVPVWHRRRRADRMDCRWSPQPAIDSHLCTVCIPSWTHLTFLQSIQPKSWWNLCNRVTTASLVGHGSLTILPFCCIAYHRCTYDNSINGVSNFES